MYDQPPGQGRRDSFADGTQVNSMANPLNSAHSVQQQSPQGFQPTSVLDQIMPSPNGLSNQDASRQLLGGQTMPSQNGMSQNTYQRRQPLMNTTRGV